MQELRIPPLDRPWTADEGAEMVAHWRKSGLSASAFVRERGFGLHRLRYWAHRLEQETPRRPDFVVVPLNAGDQADSADDEPEAPMIEIYITEERFVRVPITADRQLISETIKTVLEVGR